MLHVIALLAVFSSASGDLVSGASGGGLDGPVFEVQLVGPTLTAVANDASSYSELQPLFAKFRVEPAPNAVPLAAVPGGSFADMVERLRRDAPAQPGTQREGDQREQSPMFDAQDASLQDATGASTTDALKGPAPGASSTGGGLWRRIEPCWRDIGGARVPVTLDIRLDAAGRLAEPPTITRPSADRAEEARLVAEAKALSALAACLPRNDVSFGGRSHRLEFPAR